MRYGDTLIALIRNVELPETSILILTSLLVAVLLFKS